MVLFCFVFPGAASAELRLRRIARVGTKTGYSIPQLPHTRVVPAPVGGDSDGSGSGSVDGGGGGGGGKGSIGNRGGQVPAKAKKITEQRLPQTGPVWDVEKKSQKNRAESGRGTVATTAGARSTSTAPRKAAGSASFLFELRLEQMSSQESCAQDEESPRPLSFKVARTGASGLLIKDTGFIERLPRPGRLSQAGGGESREGGGDHKQEERPGLLGPEVVNETDTERPLTEAKGLMERLPQPRQLSRAGGGGETKEGGDHGQEERPRPPFFEVVSKTGTSGLLMKEKERGWRDRCLSRCTHHWCRDHRHMIRIIKKKELFN